MILFTLLFAGLMLLSAQSRRRVIAISLIGCLTVLAVPPAPAQGQLCLPCIILAVLATINKVIGNLLNQIIGVLTNIQNFHQQTVWPMSSVNQAKSLITAMIAQFRGLMQGIFSINPHTATLPPWRSRTSFGTGRRVISARSGRSTSTCSDRFRKPA